MNEEIINFLSYLETVKKIADEKNLNFQLTDENFNLMYFQYLTNLQLNLLREIKIELKCISNDLQAIKRKHS